MGDIVPKTVLLLGHTGKMGVALERAFSRDHAVVGRNSRDLDAADFERVRAVVEHVRPDLLINAVAMLGIDACERDPERALRLNALLPRHLARLAAERDIPFVHFSTDAVFNDDKRDFYTEEDLPSPLQVYGASKHSGDCLVRGQWERHYIFRLPILFGESTKEDQFVEKMLGQLGAGKHSIRVASDIISSPTYSRDAAERVRDLVAGEAAYGTYHIANDGQASLHDLMSEIVAIVRPDVTVERASYRDFPFVGTKNTHTPLRSVRTGALRSWREAVREYGSRLRDGI